MTSLSDLFVEPIKDKRLKARVSRDNSSPNRFNVSFIVPQALKEAFRTEVVLSGGEGGSRVPISVSFDPKDGYAYAKSSTPPVSLVETSGRQGTGERNGGRLSGR